MMGLALTKLTVDEFVAWEDGQAERHEFHRGEVYAMTAGSLRHNRIVRNLASRMDRHLDGTPCKAYSENVLVKLATGAVYPDVVVTCHATEQQTERIIEDPRLVVEVLSPSTRSCDQRAKFSLYRTAPTLREFALVDPAARSVELYVRAEAGAWLFTECAGNDVLILPGIGLEMPSTEVFRGVAPE